ncbi:MAG: S-layer homology domain-containing protein [Oscillibacter sp.]|jgi:uncharacterized repeat protein (TIGR02543 family)|nr:S-layer homology domain-containing protein [Oscillibacter sp.]
MKKKFLSIILCLVMALSLLPTAALATEDTSVSDTITPIQTMLGAENVTVGGTTITLKNDVNISVESDKYSYLYVNCSTLTLDLGGHTLTITGQGIVFVFKENTNVTSINVTIKNGAVSGHISFDGSGKTGNITVSDVAFTNTAAQVSVMQNLAGTVTLENVSATAGNGKGAIVIQDVTTVNINNCAFTGGSSDTAGGPGIFAFQIDALTINGGTYTGGNGGTGTGGAGLDVYKCTVAVTSGTFAGGSGAIVGKAATNTSGTTSVGFAADNASVSESSDNATYTKLTASGGKYTSDKQYVKVLLRYGTETNPATTAEQLAAALNDAQADSAGYEGSTVTMSASISALAETLYVAPASAITLDLAGFSITGAAGATNTDDGITPFQVVAGSQTFTVQNSSAATASAITGGSGGKIDGSTNSQGGNGVSGALAIGGSGEISIAGGATYEKGPCSSGVNGDVTISAGGTVNITAGSIAGEVKQGGSGVTGNVSITGSGTVNISGSAGSGSTDGTALTGTITSTTHAIYSGTASDAITTPVASGSTSTARYITARVGYAVTYDTGSGSGSVPEAGLKASGTDYTVSTSYPLTKAGYTQTGWKLTAESMDGKGAVTTLTANEAVTLYPVWTVNTYAIAYTLNDGTNHADNPAAYTIAAETITLQNPTRTGFSFAGWSGTGLTGNANTAVSIDKGSTGNREYTANWKADAPAAAPQGYAVDSKTDTSITISAPAGYEYSKDGVSWVSPTAGKVTFDNLTANQDYALKCRVPANAAAGQLADASDALTLGTVKTKTAPAAGGSVTAVQIALGANAPTDTKITASTKAGQEYYISVSTAPPAVWNGTGYFNETTAAGTHVYEGLTPGTHYYIHTRIAETAAAMPSASVYTEVYTLPTTPTSNEVNASVTVNYDTETLTIAGNTYQVSSDPDFGTTIEANGAITPNTTYYVRVKENSGVPASKAISFSTSARPDAPAAVLESSITKTDTAITIANTAATQEYSVDSGASWQDGGSFTGLTANNAYTVVTRVKAVTTGNPKAFASASSVGLSVTTKAAPADVSNDHGVTFSVVAGTVTGLGTAYEWRIGESGAWSTTASGIAFTAGTLYIRARETADAMPSSAKNIGTVNAASAATPDAPAEGSKTYNSVTLTAVPGNEYSRDGGTTWQDSNVFTGLSANTEYHFVTRIKATATTLSGAVSTAITVKTGSVPSGGSSSSTVTVPVSSDAGKASVNATVSGSTADVSITDTQLKTVIDSARQTGTVSIDLSGAANVNAAKIPAKAVKATAESGTAAGLQVNLSTGSVKLDDTAVKAVNGGKDVTVSVKTVKTADLTAAQKQTLGDKLGSAVVVDVNVLIGGVKQTNFNGGKVTVSIPYTPKTGEDTSKLTVWYIKADGSIENMGGQYDAAGKRFVFTTTHLSQYVLVSRGTAANPFTDVAAGAYYYDAVMWALENDVTSGASSATFNPEGVCTRAQAVMLLWNAMGKPEPSSTACPFTDVKADAYYFRAVLWAAEKGIAAGTGATAFDPNAAVTRAQAVTFLWRAAGKPAQKGGTPFSDVSAASYCADAVLWAVEKGITVGTGTGAFAPLAGCTRAQIVTFLYRDLGK